MRPAPDDRRELTRLLLARGLRPVPPRASVTDKVVKLSRGQHRLWFLEQLCPNTAQHNIALELRLERPPVRDQLETALAQLQALHEALRLRFIADDDPTQEPLDDVRTPLVWHDLTDGTLRAAEERADRIASAEARRPIDLENPPLYRATALVLPDDHWRLVLIFHHIVVDGWSVGVLLEDLAALLAGASVPRPPITFADWVIEHDDGEAPPRVSRYWQQRFADSPPATTLAPRPSSVLDDRRGGLIPIEIDRSVIGLAQRLGVTPYVVCLAAFEVLLRRLTASDTIVVGTPAAGRDDPALDRVVGFFVRTIALRTEVALSDRFADVARNVARAVLDAVDHQPMPFDDLVTSTGRTGADGSEPLFRTMFAWSDTIVSPFRWAGRVWWAKDLDTGTAKFDLTLSLGQTGEQICGGVEWSAIGADEVTARGVIRAYRAILRAVLIDFDVRVEQVPLADRMPAIADGSQTSDATTASLAAPFARQVGRTPHAVAVIDPIEGAITYEQLGERVAAAATQLRAAGLAPGQHVAVLMERSVDMIVAVHAVTAAGCAYVPIDTSIPTMRLRQLLTSASARAVVVHPPTQDLVPEGPWITLQQADASGPAPQLTLTPANASAAAYLLHTSGSTGSPKPVAFPTDASQAFLDWMWSAMPIGVGDKVMLKTPYGFDVSVWELFWPLQRGATVVVTEPHGHLDSRYLANMIQRHDVNVINFVPSMLETFVEEPQASGCKSLRWVLSAGEELRAALRDRVHQRLSATLVNLYGPTECGAITAHFLDRADHTPTVPIGQPLPHARLHVVDDTMQVLPAGLHGELVVGGELGTAIGYWNTPALTADKFVPDPFAVGLRLYRTGDACRELPDGSFEYLGRGDRQVKLHGVRVEPGEIESVLRCYPKVASARVVVVDGAGTRQLVGFYTTADDHRLDPEAVRVHLAGQLPRHLIPVALIWLERVPVNVNGKTDTAELTRIWQEHRDAHRRTTRVAAQDGSVEDEVRRAFEAVLDRAVPNGDTTFFELGGNSLLLLKLAGELERRTGYRPSITELAQHPTIRLIAATMASGTPVAGPGIVPLAPVPGAPILLLVHPAAGSVLPYVPLSRHIGHAASVYGIDAPGFGSSEAPPRTVAGFVERLLPGVESLAGSEHVVLAGWSFGGVLAYELGVALCRKGKDPLATIIIDAWIPAESDTADDGGPNSLAFLQRRGLLPNVLSRRDRRAIETVLDASTAAFRAYRPSGGLRGPVHLLRAADGYPDHHLDGYTDHRGWNAVVVDLHLADAAGNHFELLHEDHAPALAEQIRDIVASYSSHIYPTNGRGTT